MDSLLPKCVNCLKGHPVASTLLNTASLYFQFVTSFYSMPVATLYWLSVVMFTMY